MTIDYTSSCKIYDDDTGKLHRDCSFSIHASGDPISMEYIKNMAATYSNAVGAILEDTELGEGV